MTGPTRQPDPGGVSAPSEEVHALRVRFQDGEMAVDAMCGEKPGEGATVTMVPFGSRVTCPLCRARLSGGDEPERKATR